MWEGIAHVGERKSHQTSSSNTAYLSTAGPWYMEFGCDRQFLVNFRSIIVKNKQKKPRKIFFSLFSNNPHHLVKHFPMPQAVFCTVDVFFHFSQCNYWHCACTLILIQYSTFSWPNRGVLHLLYVPRVTLFQCYFLSAQTFSIKWNQLYNYNV